MRSASGRRCSRLALLGLTAVLVGAACSDPPPAAKPPKVSTAGSATRLASPTATTPEQEVEAAVRAYYAELTRAAQTNDTGRLKQMIDRNCPCYRAVRVIEQGARRGESTPDAEWRLESVDVHDLLGRSGGAEVRYDVTAYDVINRSRKTIDHVDSKTSHLDLSLVKGSHGWVVANVFDLEGD
jgi:hypothetical protein